MKYLCLVYYQESEINELSQAEWDALNAASLEYSASITESGHKLGGAALEQTHTATTICVRDGNVSAVDGPFAETKEQLAGFYALEAKDLNEAIQLASRIPPARIGRVEIRPMRQCLPTGNSRQGASQASNPTA